MSVTEMKDIYDRLRAVELSLTELATEFRNLKENLNKSSAQEERREEQAHRAQDEAMQAWHKLIERLWPVIERLFPYIVLSLFGVDYLTK